MSLQNGCSSPSDCGRDATRPYQLFNPFSGRDATRPDCSTRSAESKPGRSVTHEAAQTVFPSNASCELGGDFLTLRR